MVIWVAATTGVTALIVTWAIGLNSDVGGLIALGFLALGVLVHMVMTASGEKAGGEG